MKLMKVPKFGEVRSSHECITSKAGVATLRTSRRVSAVTTAS